MFSLAGCHDDDHQLIDSFFPFFKGFLGFHTSQVQDFFHQPISFLIGVSRFPMLNKNTLATGILGWGSILERGIDNSISNFIQVPVDFFGSQTSI